MSRPQTSEIAMPQTAVYEKFQRDQITTPILEQAAKFFSENYGVWGKQAVLKMGPFARAGMYM